MNQDGLLDMLFGFMLLLGASISAFVGLCELPDWLCMVSLSAIQFVDVDGEDATRAAPALRYGARSSLSFSLAIPMFVRFLQKVPRASPPDDGRLT